MHGLLHFRQLYIVDRNIPVLLREYLCLVNYSGGHKILYRDSPNSNPMMLLSLNTLLALATDKCLSPIHPTTTTCSGEQ